MKTQDVLLKAMAKKITWWEAGEIIGVTERTMRRWRERMEVGGYDGLADRRKGKASTRRVALATMEKVLRLFKEEYFDLNMRHFHEKLSEEHDIHLSYTWVQILCKGQGWFPRGGSGESIDGEGRDGQCQGCCSISTAASTSGSGTSAGTT